MPNQQMTPEQAAALVGVARELRRDAMASIAMHGLLAQGFDSAQNIAEQAYKLADAMLVARAGGVK